MADSKMAVSQWSPEFVQDLLPAAQKTALLYNLSYLCLAKFPNLEKLIRSRAVETQLLFGSSDAVMLKCILTSKNLVEDLFPMLVTAVEEKDMDLAVTFLGTAREWIKDIITDVNKIVDKYELHNKDVASSTSDVIKEKQDTDQKIQEQDKELKQTEQKLDDLKSLLQKYTEELEETEKKINSKSHEIQEFARSISKTREDLDIVAAVVPFIGILVKVIHEDIHDPTNNAQMNTLQIDLNRFIAEKAALKQKQWEIQLQVIDWQMKAAKASFDRNSIPDPVHLNEVQKSLTQIQAILIQIRNFWEKVAKMLDHLEKKTFVGEAFIKKITKLKVAFLKSIKRAEEAWISFGEGCNKASVIFRLQTKDAYKFLEVSPSSLSKEEWEKEYERVKKRLENIDTPQCVASSGTAAITE